MTKRAKKGLQVSMPSNTQRIRERAKRIIEKLPTSTIEKMLEILFEMEQRSKNCEECHEPFFGRLNRMYCSIRCQNVVTSRRFRVRARVARPARANAAASAST